MCTPDLLVLCFNRDLILNSFEYFQLPSINNAECAYSFSYPHLSPFHICFNLILNFIHRCPGMISGFDSQHCKAQNVKLIRAALV